MAFADQTPIVRRALFALNVLFLLVEVLITLFLFFGSGWAGDGAGWFLLMSGASAAVVAVHLLIVVQLIDRDMRPRRKALWLLATPAAASAAIRVIYSAATA